jgi:hypothetical protein
MFAMMLHAVSCLRGLRVLVSVCVDEACKQRVVFGPVRCDASGDVIATGNVAARSSTLQHCCLC